MGEIIQQLRRIPTLFLMAEPSAWIGAARVVDFFGQFDRYNFSRTPQEADARAMAADWVMVGDDIASALEEYYGQLEKDAATQLSLPLSTPTPKR